MLCYLSGSIEFAPEYGKGWRRELKPWLEQTLGHRVYDPAEDEKKNLSDDEAANFRAWKTADPARFRRTVRKIIDWDMDFIEQQADYVICFWDGPSAGTTAELTAAYRRGIPVYLVTEQAAGEISGWVLGCVEQTFSSFDEPNTRVRARCTRRVVLRCARLRSPSFGGQAAQGVCEWT